MVTPKLAEDALMHFGADPGMCITFINIVRRDIIPHILAFLS